MKHVKFTGNYKDSGITPIAKTTLLGTTPYGMAIIQHPKGFLSKEHKVRVAMVLPEDVKNLPK